MRKILSQKSYQSPKNILFGNNWVASCSNNVSGPFLLVEGSIQKAIRKGSVWFSLTIYLIKAWGLSGLAGWSFLPEEVWLGQCPPVWVCQEESKSFLQAVDCKTTLEKWTLSEAKGLVKVFLSSVCWNESLLHKAILTFQCMNLNSSRSLK